MSDDKRPTMPCACSQGGDVGGYSAVGGASKRKVASGSKGKAKKRPSSPKGKGKSKGKGKGKGKK